VRSAPTRRGIDGARAFRADGDTVLPSPLVRSPVPDPFARALRDHHRDERDAPLRVHGGGECREHPIEAFYFGDPADDDALPWIESWVDGPLLDVGAGVGRDARYFQERFETVAVEVSDALVETMRDRGVDDARRGDLFALDETFPPDRFRSVLIRGTQLGLAGSTDRLRSTLADLDAVTTADGTAVVDGYDPAHPGTADLIGYRDDPRDGLARRTIRFEYAGERGDPFEFLLFGPDRLRAAAADAGWRVAAVDRPSAADTGYYRAALRTRAAQSGSPQ
jgi:SAM-dependent methyltransferase